MAMSELQRKLLARRLATDTEGAAYESVPEAKKIDARGHAGKALSPARTPQVGNCMPEPERRRVRKSIGEIMEHSSKGQDFADLIALRKQATEESATTFESLPLDAAEAAREQVSKLAKENEHVGAQAKTKAADQKLAEDGQSLGSPQRPVRRSVGGIQDFAAMMSKRRQGIDAAADTFESAPLESAAAASVPRASTPPGSTPQPAPARAVRRSIGGLAGSVTGGMDFSAIMALQKKVADGEGKPADDNASPLPAFLPPSPARGRLPAAEPKSSLTLSGNRVTWVAECTKKALPAFMESPPFNLPGCGDGPVTIRLTFRAGVFGRDRGTECCTLSICGGAEKRTKKLMIKSFYGTAAADRPGLLEWIGASHDSEFAGSWPRPGRPPVRVGFIYQALDLA
eukprot:TRINITY_DN115512_c0_g1_i1.p1 TRINITY_DN115512_c0_g1~~TRINITY_DN115512_c0_g1_i1.p1  ORF type:complete len:399 (+),score=95.65 TRINITY_DN115512_c0_g1_i1:96-1292(+)